MNQILKKVTFLMNLQIMLKMIFNEISDFENQELDKMNIDKPSEDMS